MRSSPGRPGSALALSLRLGTAYDWIFAAAILAAPRPLMEALHFPPPADPFLFKVSAMPLVFFPFVYLAAAADPVGRPWAVRISLAFRLAGGLMLGGLALWLRPAGLHMFLTTMCVDLAWGAVHAALWRRVPTTSSCRRRSR